MVPHRLRVLVIILNYVLLSVGLYDNGNFGTSSKICKLKKRERSGSVVECLTRDQGLRVRASPASLHSGPWTRTLILA